MKFFIFTWIVLGLSVSCDKSEAGQEPTPKTTFELLTQKEWMLSGFGFDDNKNGIIDMAEDMSEECQRDNLYQFNRDGSGLYKENLKSCNTGISEQAFTWKLQKNDRELDFLSGTIQIQKITEVEMTLFNEIPLSDGSVMVMLVSYRH